eukprot:11222826-Lingulodinium_polyedra.AAC.1
MHALAHNGNARAGIQWAACACPLAFNELRALTQTKHQNLINTSLLVAKPCQSNPLQDTLLLPDWRGHPNSTEDTTEEHDEESTC